MLKKAFPPSPSSCLNGLTHMVHRVPSPHVYVVFSYYRVIRLHGHRTLVLDGTRPVRVSGTAFIRKTSLLQSAQPSEWIPQWMWAMSILLMTSCLRPNLWERDILVSRGVLLIMWETALSASVIIDGFEECAEAWSVLHKVYFRGATRCWFAEEESWTEKTSTLVPI